MALPVIDLNARSYLLEAGAEPLSQANHTAMHVYELLETWGQAVDTKKHNEIGKAMQRYAAEKRLMPVVTKRPTIQDARDLVKG